MQQKTLVSWLKAIIIIFAILLAILLFAIVPSAGLRAADTMPDAAFLFWPCMIFVWIFGTIVYLMLIEAWKVCGRISSGQPFCAENAHSFVVLCQYSLLACADIFVANAVLVVVNAVFKLTIYPISIPIFSALLIFVGLAVAVAAATLSHLIYKASDINEENQLTI